VGEGLQKGRRSDERVRRVMKPAQKEERGI
jgi:hypothetical protein